MPSPSGNSLIRRVVGLTIATLAAAQSNTTITWLDPSITYGEGGSPSLLRFQDF